MLQSFYHGLKGIRKSITGGLARGYTQTFDADARLSTIIMGLTDFRPNLKKSPLAHKMSGNSIYVFIINVNQINVQDYDILSFGKE